MSLKVISVRSRTVLERWSQTNGRPSGFDYMRISLAVMVLLWHSYRISYGTEEANLLWRSMPGLLLQMILPMFFCLSGFLVFSSLERNRNLRQFLTLRFIRIYPALCVEVIISAFILGPIVTTAALDEFFMSREFLSYLANTIGWVHFTLPGVFLENPYPKIVNTSLWTVPYELECYVLLSILFLLGFIRSRVISVVMFVACTVIVAGALFYSGESGAQAGGVHGRVLILCFLAGALMFRIKDLLPYSTNAALIAMALSVIMLRFDQTVFLAPVFVAYLTVYLGLLNPARGFIVDAGDFSYGTYLYAAPIQQTVVWIFGAHNNWALNVAVALPATVLFALFSWYAVEKPFLKLKPYLSRTTQLKVSTH